MNQANRTPLFPLAGALLLAAVTAVSTPAAAEPDYVTAEIRFTDVGYTVVPPLGWDCVAVDLADAPNVNAVELSCASVAVIPMCGTVVAGVKQQTGGVGATVAVAICGTGAQASCRGTYDPIQGAKDCSVTISGDGPAKCQFFTVGTGYNSVGYCNFPVL